MADAQITGDPNWSQARQSLERLRQMPAGAAEANIAQALFSTLGNLFPNLRYPEIANEYNSGDGPIDVYCRNVVFETKAQGKKDDARAKSDGSIETPEDQTLRYLNALASRPSMFDGDSDGWRGCVTDGREWSFYHYDRESRELRPDETLRLDDEADDDALLGKLYRFVNRTVKMAPPVDNAEWAGDLARPFFDLAARYEGTAEYKVKLDLWRGVLSGAFITPQGDGYAERHLFARHTMLVLLARAVAQTLMPQRSGDDAALADGFPNWLIDAAGDEGKAAIDNLVQAVGRYEWRASNRDTLKDLYHAVIPRDIRHDFGEYYTPDWLARAVCEDVMDADWRRGVIDGWVKGDLKSAAVLDPSCGSGTFLYHAVRLLLRDAAAHPALAGSPLAQAEIVNGLVAGLDLHPIAVELAKTTKMLAFGDMPVNYESLAASPNIYLGDSLQWETRALSGAMAFGAGVGIPSDEPDKPLRFPASLLLREQFPDLLNLIFDYANGEQRDDTESSLLAVLQLTTESDQEMFLDAYRRLRGYIQSGRDNVWKWYISNLVQPHRLATAPMSRLVGNPPWVVYNAMASDRQDVFREHAERRNLWAGAYLATQNDIAATFVASCVDYYLQRGGKFGFVMPYSALRARHWEKFRGGNWSLTNSLEEGCHVDLSKTAWDLSGVKDPPFKGSAHSSVIFGERVVASRQKPNIKPLGDIHHVAGSDIDKRMAWDDVKPLLTYTLGKQWDIAPSPAYAEVFRNGATLFPQPLVVFESPLSSALGKIYFQTNTGKGAWRGKERNGQVESRFVKSALFSRLVVPFGTTGKSHIIAPFSESGRGLVSPSEITGENTFNFKLYWDNANRDWQEHSGGRPPLTLLDQIDYQGKLSSQIAQQKYDEKVVYGRSGARLEACVVSSLTIADGTLNWFGSSDVSELHYLSAIFNAGCLAEFFKNGCRYSDRHFQMLPVQNLPIPAYDADNDHHANLAAQSVLAHERVAEIVAERQYRPLMIGNRPLMIGDRPLAIGRGDVLDDDAIKPILESIDDSVRQILPAYCS